MSRTSDCARKQQLFGSFARAGTPMGKFMWGKRTRHVDMIHTCVVSFSLSANAKRLGREFKASH